MAIFLVVVCLLHAHPGRPRIIPIAMVTAAGLVLADTFVPAPLYLTAVVLMVLVTMVTVATRTRATAGPDGSGDDGAD